MSEEKSFFVNCLHHTPEAALEEIRRSGMTFLWQLDLPATSHSPREEVELVARFRSCQDWQSGLRSLGWHEVRLRIVLLFHLSRYRV